MSVRKTRTLLGVFYLSAGAVCVGPALPAIAQSAADPADETAPIHLFDEPDGADVDLPRGQSVDVGSFGEIDLHVKDLDLTKVLQLLSIQSQRNIIASRNVAGSVSADLYGVDFYDALEAILTSNGFGYREKGNFIYVYTQEELAAMDEAERQVVTKIRRLNYLTATDASTFAQPLLSQAGSMAISGDPSAGIMPDAGNAGANSFASDTVLVIRDYPENVEQIEALLNDLDVRPRQVLVEATILQADLTEANAFGVDFSVVGDLSLANAVSPLGVVDSLIEGVINGGEGDGYGIDSGSAVQSTVGNTQTGQSGFKVGIVGGDAAVFMRALDNVTDTTVIANPKLLVLNRQRADLLVGGRIGYLSTTSTETSTTETVEFLEVGTQLSLRPFVSQDDFIRLELRPSLSTGEVRQLGSSVIPETAEQTLTTNVIVRNGQTVVLGGLFKEDTTINRNQVPGAGDIPILGAAFKGQDDSVNRSEVIFMIKPTIIRDQVLAEIADEAQEGVRLAKIGSRKSLLPWSRSKMTRANLKSAYAALEAGKPDKARWFVDLALNNEPANVDALRLKQQLTGEQMHIYDTSILENATNTMIERELERTAPAAVPAPRSAAPSQPAQQPAAEQPAASAPAGEPVEVTAVQMTVPVETVEPAVNGPAVEEPQVQQQPQPEPQAQVEPQPQPQAQAPAPAPQPIQEPVQIEAQPQPTPEAVWDDSAFEFDLMGGNADVQARSPMNEAEADAWLRQLNAQAEGPAEQPGATTDLFSAVEAMLPGEPAPSATISEVQTDAE